jgi:RNA polymerase sigma-70 factor (ECF subfamily)
MAESDETLVADLKAGRIDAFRLLYDRHRDALLRLARRILGNRADAEDAVHDAFLTLYEKVGGFRGQSSFQTWFYRILVNTCLQVRRKRKRVAPLEGEPDASAPPAELETQEVAEAMSREVAALPLRQRTVFHLAEVEGRSLKQTAFILGLEAGTVRHHFFKARQRLKQRLRRYFDEPDELRGQRSARSVRHGA